MIALNFQQDHFYHYIENRVEWQDGRKETYQKTIATTQVRNNGTWAAVVSSGSKEK